MTYQLLEQYNSTFAGPARKPQGFAIHWWGDPAQNPQFLGIVNVLLQRAREESASVNFVAEAGRVACLISPGFVAWAQGDGGSGWGNLNLVSIECNPRCSPGDRETVAELMADQHILNGIPIVAYPHKKFTATQCPGVWEQHIPWLVARAKAIVAAKKAGAVVPASSTTKPPAPKPPAKPAPKPVVRSGLHWVVQKGDTLSKIAAYYGGPTVAQIAAWNGIGVNSILKVGQKVFIPGPLVWVVDPGDTLGMIAAYYGLSVDVVARNNGIKNPNALSVGQHIKII